ncbi:MAG: hypothetical protein ACD_79C01263G0002 [uncultured bacterium]|nr:MAG: hypothetical protein ACD_79C01263G0002 [uncultured bacterium]
MKISIWKILFLLILTGGGVFFYYKMRPEKMAVTFREISPFYGDIREQVSTTGMVQPQNRLEIRPPVAGRIDEILVKEGDKAKTGQTLAWMSSTDRAALMDTARFGGENSVKYWQEVYKPTPLIAPIDGDVIVREVEPGQTVNTTDTVIVLSDRLIVQAQVDETDIGKVKMGQAAEIGLDAYPDIKVKGKVDHIYYESKVINNVTIYEVDILPDTVPDVFRSGMSANIDIIQQQKEKVLLIPQEAIKQDDKGLNFVLVRTDNTDHPERISIKTGLSDDNNTEVTEGLSPNSTIMIKSEENKIGQDSEQKANPFLPFGGRRRAR